MQNSNNEVADFALIGAGYWAEYQLAAWQEEPRARCVAVVDRDSEKARRLSQTFGVDRHCANIGDLFKECRPRFVDIVTDVNSHEELIGAAASQRIDIICQKPLASSFERASQVSQTCRDAGAKLLVHENWRWQRPIRKLKEVLETAPIGRIFRARLSYDNSFPVFENQPGLKELDDFILSDMGTHLCDVLRFLFGEPRRLFCEISRSRDDIRGEDIASLLYRTIDDVSVLCTMSYASRLERDRFPETLIVVEGDQGAVELREDCWISVTTRDGTTRRRYPPPFYKWVDSRYELVQSSMVDCQRHLLNAIIGESEAETSAEDNLKTLAMVDAAYCSARGHTVIEINPSLDLSKRT